MNAIFSIVLHAHIPGLYSYTHTPGKPPPTPFVWLQRAVSHSYMPLLALLERSAAQERKLGLALCLSPSLLAALEEPSIQQFLGRELEGEVEARTRALSEVEGEPVEPAARALLERSRTSLELFQKYRGRLVKALATLARGGTFELFAGLETAPILPLVSRSSLRRFHVQTSLQAFARRIESPARGLWLPGRAWTPSLDEELAHKHLRWTVLSQRALKSASPTAVLGLASPILTSAGTACFGGLSHSLETLLHDAKATAHYREIDGSFAVQQAVHKRLFQGHDDGLLRVEEGHARLYRPRRAKELAKRHARVWLEHLRARIQRSVAPIARAPQPRPGVFVEAWPAELWGCGWWEGPTFLREVMRGLREADDIAFRTPSVALEACATAQRAIPGLSSEAEQGFLEPWLAPSERWLQRHTRRLEEELVSVCLPLRDTHGQSIGSARAGQDVSPVRRALVQALRELMLAQSGDWPRLLCEDGHTAAFAMERVKDHLHTATLLLRQARSGSVDRNLIARRERGTLVLREVRLDPWVRSLA